MKRAGSARSGTVRVAKEAAIAGVPCSDPSMAAATVPE